MPRTALAGTAIKKVKGPNPGTVSAGDLHVAPTAADVANGNSFVVSAGDRVYVQNTHASSAFTFTLTSTVDERLRKGDITAYSLAAGEIARFDYGDLIGWAQPDGTVQLDATNAAIKYWVDRR